MSKKLGKICPTCGVSKPLSEFHKDKGSKDGHTYSCKDCACGRARQWNRDNKEAIAQYNRQRYLGTSRAKTLQSKRSSYQRGREGILARKRARYPRIREESLRQRRKYYRMHKEEMKARGKTYHQTPAGRASRVRAKARRRMRLQEGVCDLTAREWEKLCQKYTVCVYCGHEFTEGRYSDHELTMDHIVPLARGGGHTKGNVLPACWKCNSEKHTCLLGEWLPFDWFIDGVHKFTGKEVPR